MQVQGPATYGWCEINHTITGSREQTFAVHIFRIRKHLRDASTMHYNGRRAGARRGDVLWRKQALIESERWEQIQPITHCAGQDGSKSRPEANSFDQRKRCENHSESARIWKDRADGVSFDSFDQAATM